AKCVVQRASPWPRVIPEWAGAGTARAERDLFGFEDIYDQGAEPFPCEEQQQTLYRGQVAFDLGEFDSIVDAMLNFDVAQSIAENGGVNNQIPPVSNATTLGMSTGTSSGANGPYFWNFDNPVSLPSCGPLIKPNCSVDVSTQARAWPTIVQPISGSSLLDPNLTFQVVCRRTTMATSPGTMTFSFR